MGTRNLTVVVHGGKNVVAQYCQWDGYPDGQGREILRFLRKGFNRKKFIERLKVTRFITADEYDKYWEEVMNMPSTEWVNSADANKFGQAYPTLNRDLGGKVIEFIQEGKVPREDYDFTADGKASRKKSMLIATPIIPLQNSLDFQKDKLFCEWVWTLNLDNNTFTGLSNYDDRTVSWPLSNLPEEAMFLAAFESEEDEDE